MNTLTKAEADEIIIKNYPAVSNAKGQIDQALFAKLDPKGYKALQKKYTGKNGMYVAISNLRLAGRLTKEPSQALVHVKSHVNGMPPNEMREYMMAVHEYFGNKRVQWTRLAEHLPEIAAKLDLTNPRRLRRAHLAYHSFITHKNKHARRAPKLNLNGHAPPASAPPAPTLNFCPNCGFSIGLVINAVNTLSKLKS